MSTYRDYVVTVSFETDRNWASIYDFNYAHENSIKLVIDHVRKNSPTANEMGGGVYLFPAGWFFSYGRVKPGDLDHYAAGAQIASWGDDEKCKHDDVIVFGLDNGVDNQWDWGSKDQLAIAADDEHGLLAAGRKFFPTAIERATLEKAPDYMAPECGTGRIFWHHGLKYYMGVCYDGFGIRKKNLDNPGVDVFLDLIHRFYPPGAGNSGNVYFARHGLCGASKQWKVPAFGAAVFYDRMVPDSWPTGVYYDGPKTTSTWTYEDNQMKPDETHVVGTNAGIASVKIYKVV
jgi:hypothetical protein